MDVNLLTNEHSCTYVYGYTYTQLYIFVPITQLYICTTQLYNVHTCACWVGWVGMPTQQTIFLAQVFFLNLSYHLSLQSL